jgi:hypothetical protein
MRIKSGLESRKCLSCFGEQSEIEFIISPLYNLCMNTLSASFSSVINFWGKCVFWENAAFAHCSPLLSAKIFYAQFGM